MSVLNQDMKIKEFTINKKLTSNYLEVNFFMSSIDCNQLHK